MPLINKSSYKSPFFYRNKHVATIFPSAFRKVKWNRAYNREKINTKDQDFLNLDWVKDGHKKLLILSHGLEGHSNRPYIRGMAKIFNNNGYDVLAWNCRSCGGEMNKALRMYCHAHWDDLDEVIDHVNRNSSYKEISLIGFSMGANLVLNYLSQKTENLPKNIKTCVVFSAPVILEESVNTLDYKSNIFYRRKFENGLWPKILIKDKQFPGMVDLSNRKKVHKWKDFDEYFSSKINGFESADDFYFNGSPYYYLENINVPTLIINAQNDPLLTLKCSPVEIAKNHDYIHLERPKLGGHVGFFDYNEYIWSERRAFDFISNS